VRRWSAYVISEKLHGCSTQAPISETGKATIAFARKALGWQAQLRLEAMCADTWRWQRSANLVDFPNGDRQ
jgi:UDP-glucose 4-epimerase